MCFKEVIDTLHSLLLIISNFEQALAMEQSRHNNTLSAYLTPHQWSLVKFFHGNNDYVMINSYKGLGMVLAQMDM